MIHAVKALIVETGTPSRVEHLNPDIVTFQRIVGGWLEAIRPVRGNWHAYINEEGHVRGLAPNVDATRLAMMCGWPVLDVICGPTVFLGDRRGGDEGDVPHHVLKCATDLGLITG